MFLFRRLIIWLVPVVWIVGLQLVKMNYKLWWLVAAIILLQLFFTVFFISKFKFNKTFAHFVILPLLFAGSSGSFMIFIVNGWFYHLMVVLTGLGLYFLLRQYYFYFYLPNKYQPYSLESLSLYESLVAAFFVFSAAFGSFILLQMNFIIILAVIAVVVGLLTYQFFWIHKISWAKNWVFVAVIVLLIVQLLVAVSYLPTGYYVNAFVLVLFYYLMLGFSKHYLAQSLEKKRIWTYLAVGCICLLVVLLSAQWG